MKKMTMRRSYFYIGGIILFILCALGFMLLRRSSGSEKTVDSDSIKAAAAADDHADHDIAMTVSSIIDAINVGQPLDSTDYNYTGILTDGEGRPLYTDVQGTPGIWEVKVLTPNSAVISNLYLGDLLPEYLVQYILSTNKIPESPMVAASDENGKREDNLTIYNTGKCDIIIEQQTAIAANGSEGPLLKILLRKSELTTPETH